MRLAPPFKLGLRPVATAILLALFAGCLPRAVIAACPSGQLFGPPVTLLASLAPHGIAVADLDGDGILDLVVANSQSSSVSAYLGRPSGATGGGRFDAPTGYRCAPHPFSVTVADVNRDGIPDLVTASPELDSVSVLLGHRTAGRPGVAFSLAFNLHSSSGPFFVAHGDFNGDGAEDLIVLNNSSGQASVFLNDGAGSFSNSTDYVLGGGLAAAVVRDFNGDGILDVAATDGYAGGSVHGLLGQGTGGVGDGTFGPPVAYPGEANAWGIAAADLNNDGIADLVVAGTDAAGGIVSVLLGRGSAGRGDGTFSAPVISHVGAASIAVAAGDFDHDGNVDVASSDYIYGQVIVLPGLGNGHFGPPVLFPAGGALAMVSADLDADGFPDLAMANYYENTASVLLSSCPSAPPPSAAPGSWADNGVPVCSAPGQQIAPVCVSDGQGGVIIAWEDHRSGTDWDIYAQHLTRQGVVVLGWPAQGLAVCTAGGDQVSPMIASDGEGGAIVAWTDSRTSTPQLYALRITPDGRTGSGWVTNGTRVTSSIYSQVYGQMVSDGGGGAVFVWIGPRTGNTWNQIQAQRLTHDGQVASMWPPDGKELTRDNPLLVSYSLSAPRLAPDAGGGAVVVFHEGGQFSCQYECIRFSYDVGLDIWFDAIGEGGGPGCSDGTRTHLTNIGVAG